MSASVHTHPRCPTELIFEIRRAAQQAGARYVPAKRLPPRSTIPAPLDPNDGGRAA